MSDQVEPPIHKTVVTMSGKHGVQVTTTWEHWRDHLGLTPEFTWGQLDDQAKQEFAQDISIFHHKRLQRVVALLGTNQLKIPEWPGVELIADHTPTEESFAELKEVYRGHEITVTREPSMGGADMIYTTIYRVEDLFECVCDFQEGDEELSEVLQDLKNLVDEELPKQDPWDERAEEMSWEQ